MRFPSIRCWQGAEQQKPTCEYSEVFSNTTDLCSVNSRGLQPPRTLTPASAGILHLKETHFTNSSLNLQELVKPSLHSLPSLLLLFDGQSVAIVFFLAAPVKMFHAERTGMFLLRGELVSRLPLLPVICIPFQGVSALGCGAKLETLLSWHLGRQARKRIPLCQLFPAAAFDKGLYSSASPSTLPQPTPSFPPSCQ